MGDKASFVNIYPFVWKEYQDNGYVTGYSALSLEFLLAYVLYFRMKSRLIV
jgi:hypothetical protein